MLRRLGQDNYVSVLASHHSIIRSGLASHDGTEVSTQGDGFFAVFSSASAGVSAAIETQRALSSHDWPAGERVRVRMGVHSGEVAETTTGLVGLEVHRAARVAAVAHGGQILCSAAAAALVRESLPSGASLRDLGLHRLKDLGLPEQIFQVESDGLEFDFAPLRSLDNPELPNNLPGSLSEFVGRADELVTVRDLVESSRLVTLTGSGGSGKTRLALQVAADLLDGSGEGVWFIDFSPLTNADDVLDAVVSTLGLRVASGRPLLESIVDILRDQTMLLVFDNCEHVVDACAKLADAIGRACPKVHLLATSLEPLGIDGEHVYRVPSLSLPKEQPDGTVDLERSDAVQLFLMRAREHDPTFELDDRSALLVAQLCRRLDGIPLALELAAARLSSMSLRDIVDRLDQRFRLLTGGSRTALGRRRTLEATITWSYELLNDAERTILRRLCVFSGSFDLGAAEAICSSKALEAFEVDDLIGSLVAKSLVIAERTSEFLRYRLLESIREYAARRFSDTDGEAEAMNARSAHAAFYLALAERLAPDLVGPDQGCVLRRLDYEWDNLSAAFAHFLAEPPDHEAILRLGVAIERYLWNRDHVEVLGSLLEAARDDSAPLKLRVKTLHLVVFLMNTIWEDMNVPRRISEEALLLARTGDDLVSLALAASAVEAMSYVAPNPEHEPSLVAPVEDAVALARTLSDPSVLCLALVCRGIAEPESKGRWFEEALLVARQTEDVFLVCLAQTDVAITEFWEGQFDVAREHLIDTIAVAEEVGNVLDLIYLWAHLGSVLALQEIFDDAAVAIRRCLISCRRRGLSTSVAMNVANLARCASGQDDEETAALLYGAAESMFAAHRAKGQRFELNEALLSSWSNDQARLRESMGDDVYERLYRQGSNLTLEQTVNLCLGRSRVQL